MSRESLGKLVLSVAAGDEAAAAELLTLLESGDSDAAAAVVSALRSASPASDSGFEAELSRLADQNSVKPRDTGDRLVALELRARKLGSCQLLRVRGVQARRYMFLGELERARAMLDHAGSMAGSCSACSLHLMRLEALFERAAGNCDRALELATSAVEGYEELGSAGHDVNGDGVASSLLARSEALFYMERYSECSEDLAVCLRRFAPNREVWRISYQNLAWSMAQSKDRESARRLLRPLRYRYRSGSGIDRASFLWLDGQLEGARRRRRQRALKKLKIAVRIFGAAGHPEHFLGAASDVLRLSYPRLSEMRAFLLEIRPMVAGLVTDHHQRALADLYEIVGSTPSSSTWERIQTLVDELRAAAEIPVFISWPRAAAAW